MTKRNVVLVAVGALLFGAVYWAWDSRGFPELGSHSECWISINRSEPERAVGVYFLHGGGFRVLWPNGGQTADVGRVTWSPACGWGINE